MDWEGYKVRCASPEVWSRWMLAQTLELLSAYADLAALLRGALGREPLPKPPGHKGGAATDMFELRLRAEQADRIVALVRRAVERGEETAGTRGRGLGGFLEAWLEYREFIAVTEHRSRDVCQEAGVPSAAEVGVPSSAAAEVGVPSSAEAAAEVGAAEVGVPSTARVGVPSGPGPGARVGVPSGPGPGAKVGVPSGPEVGVPSAPSAQRGSGPEVGVPSAQRGSTDGFSEGDSACSPES